MMLFVASFVFIGIAMGLMALGAMLGKPPLPGGCGQQGGCDCKDPR